MKARLITAFTFIILVPMLIISLIITFSITKILNENTEDKLSYTLFAMSKLIYEDIEKIKNRITVFQSQSLVEAISFRDGSKFIGLLDNAKSDLELETVTIYEWEKGMPTNSRSNFIIVTEELEKKDDLKNKSHATTNKKLVYIQENVLRDGNNIIAVLRFQKNFDAKYLAKKVSNFKKLAGIKIAIFNGKESIASTFDGNIKLKDYPDDLKNINLNVNSSAYQTKLARITQTFVNGSPDKNLYLLVGLSKEEANKTLNSIILLIVMVASISTISSIFMGYLVSRWLSEKIKKTTTVVDRIASGDLTELIEKQKDSRIFSKDEMAIVLESVGKMSDELINIVMETTKLIEIAVDVARDLNESNEILSEKTEVQASSIEKISVTLEQMTSTVKNTAENSKKVRDLIHDTNDKIIEGKTITAEAITAMTLISESSKKISNITDLVDDIAFQTNLLSLNASVEAARAGEQGKGFAVVANEVRNLAQSSTNAVNDIKSLIEDTAEKVNKGYTLVNSSGEILEEIVAKMNKVYNSIQEVAQANSEQDAGISYVNESVQQIDAMIQSNTSIADKTMVLSNKMTSLSIKLQKLMNFFKLPIPK